MGEGSTGDHVARYLSLSVSYHFQCLPAQVFTRDIFYLREHMY